MTEKMVFSLVTENHVTGHRPVGETSKKEVSR